MFTTWYENFKTLVRDTYGVRKLPFRSPAISDLRQMFEAGKSETTAIAELAGELVEVEFD